MSHGRKSSISITAKQDAALSGSEQPQQGGKSDARGERLFHSKVGRKKSVKTSSASVATSSFTSSSGSLAVPSLDFVDTSSSTFLAAASSGPRDASLPAFSAESVSLEESGALAVSKSKRKKSRTAKRGATLGGESALAVGAVKEFGENTKVKSKALSKAAAKSANSSSSSAEDSSDLVHTAIIESRVVVTPNKGQSDLFSGIVDTAVEHTATEHTAIRVTLNSVEGNATRNSVKGNEVCNSVESNAARNSAQDSWLTSDFGVEVTDAGRGTADSFELKAQAAYSVRKSSSSTTREKSGYSTREQSDANADSVQHQAAVKSKSRQQSKSYQLQSKSQPKVHQSKSQQKVQHSNTQQSQIQQAKTQQSQMQPQIQQLRTQHAHSFTQANQVETLQSKLKQTKQSKQEYRLNQEQFEPYQATLVYQEQASSSFNKVPPDSLNFSFNDSQHTEQVGMSSNDFDPNDLPQKPSDDLDIDQLRSDVYNVFAQGGIFSSKLKNYSPRPGQIELADTVAQGLGANTGILMVEAGTGTGKTFSYLVPPILAHKRVIVSTGTKALQDQLVDKDIPNLLKILDQPRLMFMGLKGHANYICRHMFDELSSHTFGRDDLSMVSDYLDQTIEKIEDVYAGKSYGTAPNFAEMRLRLREDQRRLLSCDSLSCRKKRKLCDYANVSNKDNGADIQDSCFITAARAFAQKCSIVTINHALFFASLGISRPCFQDQNESAVNPTVNAVSPSRDAASPTSSLMSTNGGVANSTGSQMSLNGGLANPNGSMINSNAASNGSTTNAFGTDGNGVGVSNNVAAAGNESGVGSTVSHPHSISVTESTESVNKSIESSSESVTVASLEGGKTTKAGASSGGTASKGTEGSASQGAGVLKEDEASCVLEGEVSEGSSNTLSSANNNIGGLNNVDCLNNNVAGAADLNFTNMLDLSDSLKGNMTDRVMNMLPKPDVLVFDEAHTLPEVGRSFFTRRFTRDEINEYRQDLITELKEISGYVETPEIRNALGDIEEALSDLDYTLCSLEPRRYSILEFKYIHADGTNYVKVQQGLLSADAGSSLTGGLLKESASSALQESDSFAVKERSGNSLLDSENSSQYAALKGASLASGENSSQVSSGQALASYLQTADEHKSTIGSVHGKTKDRSNSSTHQYKYARASKHEVIVSQLKSMHDLAIPMRQVESLSDFAGDLAFANSACSFITVQGVKEIQTEHCDYTPSWDQSNFNGGFTSSNGNFAQSRQRSQYQRSNSHNQGTRNQEQNSSSNLPQYAPFNSSQDFNQRQSFEQNQAFNQAQPFEQGQLFNQGHAFSQNQSNVQPNTQHQQTVSQGYQSTNQTSNQGYQSANQNYQSVYQAHLAASQTLNQSPDFYPKTSSYHNQTSSLVQPHSSFNSSSGKAVNSQYATGYIAQGSHSSVQKASYNSYNPAQNAQSSYNAQRNVQDQRIVQEMQGVAYNSQKQGHEQQGVSYSSQGNGHNSQGQYPWYQSNNGGSNQAVSFQSGKNAASPYVSSHPPYGAANRYTPQVQGQGGIGVYNSDHTLVSSHSNQFGQGQLQTTNNQGQAAAYGNGGFANNQTQFTNGQGQYSAGQAQFQGQPSNLQNNSQFFEPNNANANQQANAYYARNNYNSHSGMYQQPQGQDGQAQHVALNSAQSLGGNSVRSFEGNSAQNLGSNASHSFKGSSAQNNASLKTHQSQPDHLSQKLDEIEFIAQHSRNGKYVNYGLLKAQHQDEINQEHNNQERSLNSPSSGYNDPVNHKSYTGSNRTNNLDAVDTLSASPYHDNGGKGEAYVLASGQQEQFSSSISSSNGGYWSGEDSFVKSQQQGVKASNATAVRRNSRSYASSRPYVNKDFTVGAEQSAQGAGAVKSGYANASRGYGNKAYGKPTQGYAFNANSQRRDEDKVAYKMENGREVVNLEFRGIIVRLVKALVCVQNFVKSLRNAESEENVDNALEFIEDMLAFMTDLMTTDRDKFGQPKYEFVAWVKVTDPHHDHEMQSIDDGREDESADSGQRHTSYAQGGTRVNALGGSAGIYGTSADASHKITVASDKTSEVVRDNNYEIVLAPIEIGKFLGPELRRLTAAGISIVFASATITTSQDFSKFCYDLGLSQDEVQTKIVESPFDYAKNARIMYSQSFVDVNDPQRMSKHVELLKPVIDASPGGVFFLTTSYTSLKEAEQECIKHFSGKRRIYVQGSDSINNLMEAFRKDGHGILIGTSSFWEGVDVPGQALSLVIIDKLPFKTANDPVNRARMDYCDLTKGNSFYNIAVPEAIIKLRQGVGRLIRNEKDLGALIILDPRLESKKYGQTFVSSLPPMTRVKSFQEILEFFKYIKNRPHQA